MSYLVKVFEKKVEKKDGTSFPKKLAVVCNGTGLTRVIELGFSKTALEDFDKERIKKDLVYPIVVELEEGQYFIVEDVYVGKDDEEHVKEKLVITNFVALTQGEFESDKPRKTISDLFK